MGNIRSAQSRIKFSNIVKLLLRVILGVLFLLLAKLLLRDDFTAFIKWWAVLLLFGITFLPLSQRLFSNYHDNGYLFSKTIGLAVSGYLMWLLSSLRILKFTSVSCVLLVLFCIAFNVILLARLKTVRIKAMLSAVKIRSMVSEELLFLIFFIVWTYIRGFKPEAYGTEKFMDYGFMAAMIRGDYMPPKDLWFAGSTINYYYVGQYMAAFMTRISGVTVNVGYNLMLMTLAAFAFVLPYSLVYNVTKNFLNDSGIKHKKSPVIAGILSGAGVSLAGNLHFTLYYWVVPIVRTILGIKEETSNYWFPNSTRYIGYNPVTKDKTIHEFPNYSFVLGDLHAHVINIIFVLTVLGILFGWLQSRKKLTEGFLQEAAMPKHGIWKEIWNPFIILIGFLIGLFKTTNFWDYPIYYVVSGAVILLSNLVVYSPKKDTVIKRRSLFKPIWLTALEGIAVIIIAEITALPFTLKFKQISTQIRIAQAHTPVYQLIILWGLPVALILGLLIELLTKYFASDSTKVERPDGTDETKTLFVTNPFIRFVSSVNISELFVLILGLCAMGLVLIPELIYVKDIYSGDYKRANTMFKLTYQAFILFGVSGGFIFMKFMKDLRFKWQIKFTIITFLLFISSLWYSKVSIEAWYGNIFQPSGYEGLDAQAFLKDEMPDDFEAIKWLNNNVKGTPVILEANGDSYSDYERVSAATGLPTILGWYVHEWLWRGNTKVLDERAADIESIYTASDYEQLHTLILKYNIEYLYVGKLERDKFTDLNDEVLKAVGEIVYLSPKTDTKPYETYIVHVNPQG